MVVSQRLICCTHVLPNCACGRSRITSQTIAWTHHFIHSSRTPTCASGSPRFSAWLRGSAPRCSRKTPGNHGAKKLQRSARRQLPTFIRCTSSRSLQRGTNQPHPTLPLWENKLECLLHTSSYYAGKGRIGVDIGLHPHLSDHT